MKKSILVLLSLLFVSSGCGWINTTGGRSVIYGEDDRVDIYQVENKDVLKNASAVGSMWEISDVENMRNGNSSLRTIDFGTAYNLIYSEPFRSQPVGAFCTVFLVAPDVVVTAGHCTNRANYKNKLVVFGYRMNNKTVPNLTIPTSSVYKIKEVLGWNLSGSTGSDFAVLRLDRKVVGITPLKVSTKTVKWLDYVYVLGHPCGLPLKYAPNGKVESSLFDAYFNASVDTYGGNSGSPVFNKCHEVVGILVRGETDFTTDNTGRRRSARGVSGESVTRVSEWIKFVK